MTSTKKESPISFSVNVDETVKKFQAIKGNKILICMDGTEYSNKAVDYVLNNMLKETDNVLLVRYVYVALMCFVTMLFFLFQIQIANFRKNATK